MAVKCNITDLVLSKLKELYWDTKANVDKDILQNYLESLGCVDYMPIPCVDVPCSNDTIVLTCNMVVAKISKTELENTITFYIESEDFTGGTPPFMYHWTYEVADFDNSGTIDTDKAILTVKLGKKLNLLVTGVTVRVTDSNGCIVTKNCFLANDVMQCANNYVACDNSTSLSITNKNKFCPGASGLIVNNK